MKKFILTLLFSIIFIVGYSQSGDCPGLCITANGSYAATNGSTAELNASNRGCLIAGEANSSFWFQVCFTTNGTFQFYIDPSGNRNDFDFAIWNTAACPPTTSPIRCSWAAVPPGGCALCDYTGLGTNPITSVLAADVSEGAGGDGWLAPLAVTSGQCITININNYGSGSNNFTINLGGTTAGMTCGLLPIELLSFDGYNYNTYNYITWLCASELNNDYFRLERSSDAVNWTQVAIIDGAGTANVETFYSHKDYSFEKGLIDDVN